MILSSSAAYLTNVNGTLFFSNPDGTNGSALWKSDGTTDGTVVVNDVAASGLFNANGMLYFTGTDANGAELWKSDGTSNGTSIVADINPGPDGSFPQILATSGGRMFFTANDGTHGGELWGPTIAPTSITLSSSANPVVVGKSVSIAAKVTSIAAGTFTGTVSFMEGGTQLGTAPVNAGGIATFTTTSLTAGTHTITATYAGDAIFPNGATTSSVSLLILATAPDYTLTANPTTATIRAGQSATFAITAVADQYFNGTITFGCGALPAGVTCSFSPATLNPTSAGPAVTTLTVTTTSQSTALTAPIMPVGRSTGTALWASLGGIGLFGCVLVGRRRKAGAIALAILALALAAAMSGCGGGSPQNPNATPIGASTVQVTATATAGTTGGNTATHQMTITINVQ